MTISNGESGSSVRAKINTSLYLIVAANQTAQTTLLGSTGSGDQTVTGWNVTIPAGSMGANSILKVACEWTETTGATNKLLKITLDGTVIGQTTVTTAGSPRFEKWLRSAGSQTSQYSTPVTSGDPSSGGSLVTYTKNFVNALDLTFSFAIADSAQTVTPLGLRVWIESPSQ